MRQRGRLVGITLIVAALCVLFALSAWAAPAGGDYSATVLFTHDLHSHFLPQADSEGGESGGYARLKTALDRERTAHPEALTVDGGDFSIGSLIQTLYTSQAPELRTMGAMGYDAVTAGNHEFDHEGTGFAEMLASAVLSSDPVPALVMSNYKPAADNPDRLDIQRAMAAYGVTDYMVLERGGVTYGIFGLMGTDSRDCAPASGFTLEDPVESAQRCVDALREQGAQFIVCLSHGGTNEKKKLSEDEQLAEKVEGIDLIVSGHTHTTLEEPVVVGDTYIVSSGPYCENLGSITFTWDEGGEKTLVDYHLTPIDETLHEDPEIAAMVEEWKAQVGGSYLSRYSMTYDQVLTTAGFSLETPEEGIQSGNALGELVADAFLWAAKQASDEEQEPVVAVTAAGVLRSGLSAGEITVSQAFDVLSMGVGADGTSGYPLVSCYLTGKELKAVAEVDASVTPLMPAAQLYVAGMEYSFNTHRMFFNRVTDAKLYETVAWAEDAPLILDGSASSGTSLMGYTVHRENRTVTELEDEKLYRVVTGMYSAQMLGTVKSKSLGLLSLVPKDEQGEPITDFTQHIVRDRFGSEVKEWYALAAYLQSFGEGGLSDTYAKPDGRKDVSRSWNPVELLKSPNWITLAAIALFLVAAALVWLLVRWILVLRRRRHYGGGLGRRSPFRW